MRLIDTERGVIYCCLSFFGVLEVVNNEWSFVEDGCVVGYVERHLQKAEKNGLGKNLHVTILSFMAVLGKHVMGHNSNVAVTVWPMGGSNTLAVF